MSPTKVQDQGQLEKILYLKRKYHFNVFPLYPGKKSPAFAGWQRWAVEADIHAIEQYAIDHPNTNWGIYTQDMVVIDLDVKSGPNGVKEFQALCAQHKETPPTLVVRTPSGGFHLYFSGADVPGSASTLGPGIDVRSRGNLVVAPGSVFGDKVYELVQDLPPAKIPDWLLNLIKSSRSARPLAETLVGPIYSGQRNVSLFQAAAYFRKKGISKKAASVAIHIENEARCIPPLSRYEVDKLIESAYRYDPKDGEAIAALAEEIVDSKKTTLLPASELLSSPAKAREWLIKDLVLRRIMTVLVSPGGSGKSSFSLLAALALVTGRPLLGRDRFQVPTPLPVWLYSTEDPLDELHRRLEAYCNKFDIPPSELKHLYLTSGVKQPLTLVQATREGFMVNTEAVEVLIQNIRKNNISLLIIDPFIRAHQVDENSNTGIDQVMKVLIEIMEQTNVGIFLIHHTKKTAMNYTPGDPDNARGASALIDAARMAFTLGPMREDDQAATGVDAQTRRLYRRLDYAKNNLLPPADRAIWFRWESINLACGESIGVLARRENTVDQQQLDQVLDVQSDPQPLNSDIFSSDREKGIFFLTKRLIRSIPLNGSIMLRDFVEENMDEEWKDAICQSDDVRRHLRLIKNLFKNFLGALPHLSSLPFAVLYEEKNAQTGRVFTLKQMTREGRRGRPSLGIEDVTEQVRKTFESEETFFEEGCPFIALDTIALAKHEEFNVVQPGLYQAHPLLIWFLARTLGITLPTPATERKIQHLEGALEAAAPPLAQEGVPAPALEAAQEEGSGCALEAPQDAGTHGRIPSVPDPSRPVPHRPEDLAAPFENLLQADSQEAPQSPQELFEDPGEVEVQDPQADALEDAQGPSEDPIPEAPEEDPHNYVDLDQIEMPDEVDETFNDALGRGPGGGSE